MKLIDVLKGARKKIVKGWTRGAAARTKHREVCAPTSTSAVSWCAMGSIWSQPCRITQKNKAIDLFEGCIGEPVPLWNDSRKRKSQVLAVFDKIIDSLDKKR